MVVDAIAVLGALALAVAFGSTGLRRRTRSACARCGRVLILGERTCDCAE
jgi:hypothetical protein